MELTESDILQSWLDNGYTAEVVKHYPHPQSMEFEIEERGFECVATMHQDDASRIEFLNEPQQIRQLLKD